MNLSLKREESAELAGQQRAHEIVRDFMYEKRKRATFTYKMGSELVEAKAKTSLDRANKFHDELRGILNEISCSHYLEKKF